MHILLGSHALSGLSTRSENHLNSLTSLNVSKICPNTSERKRNVALPSAPLKAERTIGLNLRLLLF